MSNLQVVSVTVTPAQATALRKLSLRGDKTAEQIANKLFDIGVRGRFTAVAKTVAEDAATRYDNAVSGGFAPPMERAPYITKAVAEYREILAALNGSGLNVMGDIIAVKEEEEEAAK